MFRIYLSFKQSFNDTRTYLSTPKCELQPSKSFKDEFGVQIIRLVFVCMCHLYLCACYMFFRDNLLLYSCLFFICICARMYCINVKAECSFYISRFIRFFFELTLKKTFETIRTVQIVRAHFPLCLMHFDKKVHFALVLFFLFPPPLFFFFFIFS